MFDVSAMSASPERRTKFQVEALIPFLRFLGRAFSSPIWNFEIVVGLVRQTCGL